MRRHYFLALAVLTIVLLAGASVWAANGNGSTYVSDTIPTVMVAGVTYTPTVTMHNSGTSTWTDGSGSTDYNFGPPDTAQNVTWGPRADSGGVAPGADKTFTVSMTPTTGGTYTVQFQMVEENIEWFGATASKTVFVIGNTQTVTIQRGLALSPFTAATGGVNDSQCARPGNLIDPADDATAYNYTFPFVAGNQTSFDGYGGTFPDNVLNHYGTTAVVRLYPDLNGSRPNPGTHTIFKFDVSFIPAGSVIDSARFKLTLGANGGPADYINLKLSPFVAGRDWVEGTERFYPGFNGGSVPTWDGGGLVTDVFQKFYNINDPANVPWGVWGATKTTAPNQDIDDTRTVGSIKVSDLNAGTVDVTSMVQDWVNAVIPNNGFNMWGGDGIVGTGSSRYDISLSENTTAANRPRLIVTFHNNAPTVTAPVGNAFISTLNPTVTWNSNAGATVINHQVRVCSVDDANGTGGAITYDSGTVAGSGTSQIAGPLANNTKYYAFVREQTGSGWTLWSMGAPLGNGGFNTSVSPPAAPVITTPTGTISYPKVSVIFTGAAHTAFRVKIFQTNVANPETAGGASYDSGDVASTAFSTNAGMLANHGYYVFAKLQNAAGWGSWSTGYAFTVLRRDWVDLLQFNETTPNFFVDDNPGGTAAWANPADPTQLTNPDRQDGFTNEIANMGTPSDNVWSVGNENGFCGAVSNNKLMVLEHPNPGGTSTGHDRTLRVHKCQDEIDLDRGVTLCWEMSVENEDNLGWGGKTWLQCTAAICDKGTDGVFHMASVRCTANAVRIVSNNTDAQAGGGAGWTSAGLTASSAMRRFRLTGRNQVAGDYSSTKWTVYVDDVEKLTSIGTFVDNAYAVDFVAFGMGQANQHGKWSWDWIGVNGGGDYGPGEWEPVPASQSNFASIGAAKKGIISQRAATITGPAVITKVATHIEVDPVTLENITIQDGYYVQDIASLATDPNLNTLVSGIRVVTSDSQAGAVAAGAKVTHLSGTMAEQGGSRALVSPVVTIEGTASYNALALSQKSLMSPCMAQNAGSSFDTSGMFVRVFGRVQLSNFDPNWGTLGAYLFYVDDGSGLADGRESTDGVPVPGIRCFSDAADPNVVAPSVGDYVMIEGICAYEEAIVDGAPKNVRTILLPTYTIITSGV